MPGKRQAGWPSLLVTFLLATQEKSDSAAGGGRKPAAGEQITEVVAVIAEDTGVHHFKRQKNSNPTSTQPLTSILSPQGRGG